MLSSLTGDSSGKLKVMKAKDRKRKPNALSERETGNEKEKGPVNETASPPKKYPSRRARRVRPYEASMGHLSVIVDQGGREPPHSQNPVLAVVMIVLNPVSVPK